MVAIAASIGLLAGYNMNFKNESKSLFKSEAFQDNISAGYEGRVEEILRFVESTYVDEIDSEQLTLNVINRMLEDLDPHSSYITPEELSSHNERMKGSYRGIGIETLSINDSFYVTNVLVGSSAEKAGIEKTMMIRAVDGVKVSGSALSIDSLSQMLKAGDKDEIVMDLSTVAGEEVQTTVAITDVSVPSADLAYLIRDDVIYLRLRRFSANTYKQYIESLDSLMTGKESAHLILDLRDNPGGYLPEAIKVLSQLFDRKSKLLTYTKGLNREKQEYRSTGNNFYDIRKVAVLINGNSASGSEIIAGAIQDWDRGMLIGERTYGKGLVQEVFPLRNGGALRLTVAKYFTPSGRLIQRSYDSATHAFAADSLNKKTKLLERIVPGGDGIHPDRKVVADKDCLSYAYYMDEYVLDLMHENRGLGYDADFYGSAAYQAFVQEHFDVTISSSAPCKDRFKEEVIKAHKNLTMKRVDFLKSQNEKDPVVSAALKYIDNPKPTIALLPQEN